ncbi:MAG: hypothetical protein AAF799_17640 [Myxococcota bacterium]
MNRVLLVSEDRVELDALHSQLTPHFDVRTAIGATEALYRVERAKRKNQEYQVVCSTYELAEMSGPQLIASLARYDRGTIGVLLTRERDHVRAFFRSEVHKDGALMNVLLMPVPPPLLLESIGSAARLAQFCQAS